MEKALLILAAVLFLTGCSPIGAGMEVLMGNYAFTQGQYQKAILHYNKTQNDQEIQPWISYNLGNVYYALGEGETSMELWKTIDKEQDPQLQFTAHFNQGVFLYESGMYQGAYEEFRKALVLNPSDLATKKNLELSLDKSRVNRDLASGTVQQSEEFQGGDSHPMMNFLKQLEITDWSAGQKEVPQWDENAQDW